MKLKDVIKSACSVILLDDVSSALDNQEVSEQMQEKIDAFVRYFNRVQEEISSEFLPVFYEENLVKENSLNFSELEKQILDVVYIKDENGHKLNYTLYPDHISFKGKMKTILYSIIPEDISVDDNILYLVPLRVYSYGILREYFLDEGLLDKAASFEEKFKNSIDSLLKKDKEFSYKVTKKLPKRLWF